VLRDYATRLVGSALAPALSEAWREFEDALVWQPLVGLYCAFGFCWQRTWDRPFVPDLEAVPAAERDYYERHGCFQFNNPGINDFGKDVLFDLITRESGAKMAADMDRELLPRVCTLISKLVVAIGETEGEVRAVFTDLRDRARAYLHWATSLRNVCAWCECVYGYLESNDPAVKAACEKKLQDTIDLELANIRELIELLETTPSEVIAVSASLRRRSSTARISSSTCARSSASPSSTAITRAHRQEHLLASRPRHHLARGVEGADMKDHDSIPRLVIAREAKPTAAIQLEFQMDCFVTALLAMTT